MPNERTNLHIPKAYKDLLRERGINLAEFVREAMLREFKRRKIPCEAVEVLRGQPSHKTE